MSSSIIEEELDLEQILDEIIPISSQKSYGNTIPLKVKEIEVSVEENNIDTNKEKISFNEELKRELKDILPDKFYLEDEIFNMYEIFDDFNERHNFFNHFELILEELNFKKVENYYINKGEY